jgi:ubiquitin fusion degradation protein 1
MQFKIMDLKPANAVTIIECDMNVEFDAPDGYVEPERVREMVCNLLRSLTALLHLLLF